MKAPTFTVQTSDEEEVSLPQKGILVLYFYPNADTPGCTLEGKTFTKMYPEFIEEGAMIWGISPNTVEEQIAFKEKFNFTFPLLADHDHAIADAYGVWGEKSVFGKKYDGVHRKTYLIVDGEIVQEWDHKPGKTEEDILKAVKNL